jgi:hypothetical protein
MEQSRVPLDQERVEQLAGPIFAAVKDNYQRGPTSRDRALEALNALAACAATVIVGCDGPGGEAEAFFQQALKQNIQSQAGHFGVGNPL